MQDRTDKIRAKDIVRELLDENPKQIKITLITLIDHLDKVLDFQKERRTK